MVIHGSIGDIADRAKNVEEPYARHESVERLRRAICHLRPTLRNVVELRQSNDRSVKEIAEFAGISVAATKSRLLRARKLLRKALEQKICRFISEPGCTVTGAEGLAQVSPTPRFPSFVALDRPARSSFPKKAHGARQRHQLLPPDSFSTFLGQRTSKGESIRCSSVLDPTRSSGETSPFGERAPPRILL